MGGKGNKSGGKAYQGKGYGGKTHLGKGKGTKAGNGKGKGKQQGGNSKGYASVRGQWYWQCPSCLYNHPPSHTACFRCEGKHGQTNIIIDNNQKPTAKVNRWSRKARRVYVERDFGEDYEDYDGYSEGCGDHNAESDEDMEVKAPSPSIPAHQLKAVLSWLKDKGADQSVLDTIGRIHSDGEGDQKQHTDPLKIIQSSRDRLKNIMKQVTVVDDKIAKSRAALDTLIELRDSLQDKARKPSAAK